MLRRIFEAILQLQAVESQLEFEINYTYDVIAREQRKENAVNQFLNAANFAQGGTFGIIEPVADLRNKFVLESTCGVVSAGVGTVLPVIGIAYNKFAKASHLAPPAFMSPYLNGKPVDGSGLPPLVLRYFDSLAPGESRTRREVLNTDWKKRFRADINKKKTLHGIDDGKARSQNYLQGRMNLLWSLYTTIEDFDSDLLSFLNQVRGIPNAEYRPSKTIIGASGADDAARLLHLEPVIAELNALTGAENERKRDLRLTLLETLVSGSLDMTVAGDKCQKELNYQYDVVLAQLTDRQSSFTQKIYEANFIQGGTFGAIASALFLKKQLISAGEVLLVSSGIGAGLTAISFLALQGGWRKNQTGPNSLADFFNLRPDHGFSPLVFAYLNSASPKRSDGKTRRECLMEYWAKNGVTTVSLKDKRTLEKLASMPSCKWDTIKLVLNRTALLSSLREQYNEFNVELRDLLRKAWPVTLAANSPDVNSGLSPSVDAAATVLGVQGLPAGNQQSDENAKLLITRAVLEGFLSMTADANVIGLEVDREFKVLDRMERQRDKIIQITNNANFLQQSTLGFVSTSLGLAGTPADVLATNRISIVSAGVSSGLALATMLEQYGGWRRGKAEPNALGAVFKKESEHKLSPVTIRYLDMVVPNSTTNLSRREVLIKYWKESKVLSVNTKRDSTVQKLCVEGNAHRWWSETTRLIDNRISMLLDLRAVMRSSNVVFGELLKAID
ncbi:MAG: hypothetical protein K2W95_04775 [Candidatus Obscuribacterales bacterium]|nr:hypothetical protein [Candidatus Obscuribacterales bacterium]